jgi:putative FmdB family regulatory protein
MPTYSYSCAPCGTFALVRPMAASADPACCPQCGAVAQRVFGSPALAAVEPGLRRAMDASARSADTPQIVSSVPGRSTRATPITRDPRHARLPRP